MLISSLPNTYLTIPLNFFPISCTHFYHSQWNFFPNFNFGRIVSLPKNREFARKCNNSREVHNFFTDIWRHSTLHDFHPGVLRFGLHGSLPLEPWNPYLCLRVILAENGTCFWDFSQNISTFFTIFRCLQKPENIGKTDPCLGIFCRKWNPCLGISCEKGTQYSDTSPYVPPPPSHPGFRCRILSKLLL